MRSTFKVISISLMVCVITALVVTYAVVRHQIDHMLGGNTTEVDPQQFQALSGSLAITNVNVLSANGQSMRGNQTILIQNDKIVAVSEHIDVPDSYTIINGHGAYVIPGLIDSHVHIKKSHNDLLLYLANGVTQVVEMTGMPHHFQLKQDVKQKRLGPQIFVATPKMNTKTSMHATFRSWFEKRHQNFTSPESARQAVRDFKEQGFDAIKLSSTMTREVYYAINDEAQKMGIEVIGHLPTGLTLEDMFAAGQSQLAHIDSTFIDIVYQYRWITPDNKQAFIHDIKQRAKDVAPKLKANNITLSSTIWLHQTREQQDYDLEAFFRSIEVQYQNPGWLEGSMVSRGCLPGGNSYDEPNNSDEEKFAPYRFHYRAYQAAFEIMMQELLKHEIAITAGTDALGACGMIAGFSLHNELQTLNKLGMTPAQTLHSTTAETANWLGVQTGRVQQGYRADLVLLAKNPLDSIANTKTIRAVIANGRYLDRKTLDNMLAEVAKANQQSRKTNIDHLIK